MQQITPSQLAMAEWALIVTIVAYFLLNGAQLFETAVIVPKWTSHPPCSFTLLKGIDLKTFWIIVHSIHELTFIAALFFCWKIDVVRNWLLILLLCHIIVRVWTLLYFAPNIMAFQASTYDKAEEELFNKVTIWKNLNYLRVGIYFAISVCLIPLLTKVAKYKLLLPTKFHQ